MAKTVKKVAKPRSAGWTGVYEALRHDILSLALPPGELLDEMGLSHRFGFSRSPIREALIRLSGDGLVVNLPNRTTIVAPVDIAPLSAICRRARSRAAHQHQARGGTALRTPTSPRHRGGTEGLHRRREVRRDHLAMSEANKPLPHGHRAAPDGNPYFAAFYEKLLDEGRRILHLHFDYIEKHPTTAAC